MNEEFEGVQVLMVEIEKSTNVKRVGYVEERSELYVEFKNGDVVRYVEVPKDKHSELMAADSKGSYMYHNVSYVYSYNYVRRGRSL